MGYAYTFTVFTPTYNRAGTVERVYRSLKAQTFRDFEWLIVDDGSTDDTGAIVERWQREAAFPVRYHRQENAGKHVAFNTGVRLARGELFLPLDSDDECVPTSLERLLYWWHAIPDDERSEFSAVTVLCNDQHGKLVGDPFPRSPLDSTGVETRLRYRVRGEKWGFQRTDVLRENPFPEPPGVKYVAEDVLWRMIDRSYKTRFVNEALRIYWRDEQGKRSISDMTADGLPALVELNRQTLDDMATWFFVNPVAFLKAAANVSRYGLHQGLAPGRIVGSMHPATTRLMVALLLPVGVAAFLRDRSARRAGS